MTHLRRLSDFLSGTKAPHGVELKPGHMLEVRIQGIDGVPVLQGQGGNHQIGEGEGDPFATKGERQLAASLPGSDARIEEVEPGQLRGNGLGFPERAAPLNQFGQHHAHQHDPVGIEQGIELTFLRRLRPVEEGNPD